MEQEIINPGTAIIEQPRNALVSAPATPADIVLYAMKNGGSIADIREFMALQREWEADQARKAYVVDMAEFKRNPPHIIKDKLVAFNGTSYMHATLGNVAGAIVEGLAQHGFSHHWDTEQQQGGQIVVTCIITHRLGHTERTMLSASRDDSGKKNSIQQMASTVTYLQRYTLLGAVGLATHDQGDDDGAGAAALDTSLADKWIADASRASTLDSLKIIWNDGSAAIQRRGTDYDLVDFKAAVNSRKAQLTPAEPNKSSRLRDIVGAGQQPATQATEAAE